MSETTTRQWLCAVPGCPEHSEVEWRAITTDGMMAWCFAGGSGLALTPWQLANFQPDATENLCARCRCAKEYFLGPPVEGPDYEAHLQATEGQKGQ